MHGKHKGHGGPASLTTRRCPGAGLGTAGTDGRRRALSPTPSTKRLSRGRPHQRGVAFPASDPPQGSVGFTRGSPSDPLSRGYLVSPRLLSMGEAPRLTSNWKSGIASASRGGVSGTHTPGPAHRDLRHSPPCDSGRRHCDGTLDSEKGTARLPCSQNNTLADNCWIAFKQFCLHTSKNAPDYGFYSHVQTTSTEPRPAAEENQGTWRRVLPLLQGLGPRRQGPLRHAPQGGRGGEPATLQPSPPPPRLFQQR